MKFWFHTHAKRPQARELAERAHSVIEKAGGERVSEPGEADFAVAIGGDGTVVAAHRLARKPIIGVNAGTLGYLPRIEPDELEDALMLVMRGEFELETRMTLSGMPRGGEIVNALNDVALVKRDARVIRFTVNVDGVALMRYTADGIIAATPTGSTGYSLSAGGPIVDPLSELIVLTPIAPHTLLNRAIALSPGSRVTLNCSDDALICVDGESMPLPADTPYDIWRSSQQVQFVTFGRESFIDRLRRKLS